MTDGVFSADPQDVARAEFHPAINFDAAKVKSVANQMRHCGLRWLVRHGHLDSAVAQDMGEWRHAGGWSVDASSHLPGWDRHGLERLTRYCARPALAAGRLSLTTSWSTAYAAQRSTAAPKFCSPRCSSSPAWSTCSPDRASIATCTTACWRPERDCARS